jgi:hypothetical protein
MSTTFSWSQLKRNLEHLDKSLIAEMAALLEKRKNSQGDDQIKIEAQLLVKMQLLSTMMGLQGRHAVVFPS